MVFHRLTKTFVRSSNSSNYWARFKMPLITKKQKFCQSLLTLPWKLLTLMLASPSQTSWWLHSQPRQPPVKFAHSLSPMRSSKTQRPKPGCLRSTLPTAAMGWLVIFLKVFLINKYEVKGNVKSLLPNRKFILPLFQHHLNALN